MNYRTCFFLIFILSLPLSGFTQEECVYIAPRRTSPVNVFETIKAKSKQSKKTFGQIAAYLFEMKDSCQQFYFKYPLRDRDQARAFAKVMQIKAQEAHRFVPVIALSHFIEPRHLGFARSLLIADGPMVQELVLVDSGSGSIIFIEEFALINGKNVPGAFVALNQLVKEKGSWYFTGIYLYDEKPTEQEIEERKEMFRATYDNMIEFIEKKDVDKVFNRLQKY